MVLFASLAFEGFGEWREGSFTGRLRSGGAFALQVQGALSRDEGTEGDLVESFSG